MGSLYALATSTQLWYLKCTWRDGRDSWEGAGPSDLAITQASQIYQPDLTDQAAVPHRSLRTPAARQIQQI